MNLHVYNGHWLLQQVNSHWYIAFRLLQKTNLQLQHEQRQLQKLKQRYRHKIFFIAARANINYCKQSFYSLKLYVRQRVEELTQKYFCVNAW